MISLSAPSTARTWNPVAWRTDSRVASSAGSVMASVSTLFSSTTGTNLHCFMNRWVRTSSMTGACGYCAPVTTAIFRCSERTARQSLSETYPRSTRVLPNFSRESNWTLSAVRSSSSSISPLCRKTSPTSLRDFSAETLILNDFNPLFEFLEAVLLARQFVDVFFKGAHDNSPAYTLFVREAAILKESYNRDRLVPGKLPESLPGIKDNPGQFFLDLLDSLLLFLQHDFRVHPGSAEGRVDDGAMDVHQEIEGEPITFQVAPLLLWSQAKRLVANI